MIILVSGATRTVKKLQNNKHLGKLKTPQDGNSLPNNGIWAADNAAYSNWDETKFKQLLNKIYAHHNKPVFVACPDVVGNAKKTLCCFEEWEPYIHELRLNVALVLQNGQEGIGIPWHLIEAIFIGGDDEFKLGGWVKYIVPVAKERGKWVHMGRVNSLCRVKYAYDIGCNSIDGSQFSMFSDTYLPKYLRFLDFLDRQGRLF